MQAHANISKSSNLVSVQAEAAATVQSAISSILRVSAVGNGILLEKIFQFQSERSERSKIWMLAGEILSILFFSSM